MFITLNGLMRHWEIVVLLKSTHLASDLILRMFNLMLMDPNTLYARSMIGDIYVSLIFRSISAKRLEIPVCNLFPVKVMIQF